MSDIKLNGSSGLAASRPDAIKNYVDAMSGNGFLSSFTGAESYSNFISTLNSITGSESAGFASQLKNIDEGAFHAIRSIATANFSLNSADLQQAKSHFQSIAGNESFSLDQEPGKKVEARAASMYLNELSSRQTPAADALFKVVVVPYETETVEFKVRAAAIGTYQVGNTAFAQASDSRPIFSLLRSGKIVTDETLALYPVYPADQNSRNRDFFVTNPVTTEVTYPSNDSYGRDDHDTAMLAVPKTIPNFMGLCQTPGQPAWHDTDEIETNSVGVDALRIVIVKGQTETTLVLNTRSITNRTLAPNSLAGSSEERGLNMQQKYVRLDTFTNPDGTPVDPALYAEYTAAGYHPLIDLSFNLSFHRGTRTMKLSSGALDVSGMVKLSDNEVIINQGTKDTVLLDLLNTLKGKHLDGAAISANVTNDNRGNFGHRVEVFDSIKRMGTKRETPISVKYPIDKENINNEALAFATEQLSIILNNQMSVVAFKAAEEHLDYLTRINGSAIVGINNGDNILPAQYYLTPTIIDRKMKLADTVSVMSNEDVLMNVNAALVNEIYDIIYAINTNSGISAIKEYSNAPEMKWNVIVHSNLARFLMLRGESRTFGGKVPFDVIPTNFDSQVGRIIIVPANESTAGNIDVTGGMGVCVAKEHWVVKGNTTRSGRDHGITMTLPTYKHHALNVVAGVLNIEDAEDFLGNDGLLNRLAKLRTERINQSGGSTGGAVSVDGWSDLLSAMADQTAQLEALVAK